MSDKSNFIVQIQQEEKNAKDMLNKAESDNNKRVAQASEDSMAIIQKSEDDAREEAMIRIKGAKEEAKEVFKKIIVEGDNSRRDVVEGGKVNLPKAVKHVSEVFSEMFSQKNET